MLSHWHNSTVLQIDRTLRVLPGSSAKACRISAQLSVPDQRLVSCFAVTGVAWLLLYAPRSTSLLPLEVAGPKALGKLFFVVGESPFHTQRGQIRKSLPSWRTLASFASLREIRSQSDFILSMGAASASDPLLSKVDERCRCRRVTPAEARDSPTNSRIENIEAESLTRHSVLRPRHVKFWPVPSSFGKPSPSAILRALVLNTYRDTSTTQKRFPSGSARMT